MKLIVCEKDIAAKRIASILSNNKVEIVKGNPPIYKFDDTVVIGLKGHIIDIDFPEDFKSWKSNLNELIHSNIIKLRKQESIIKKLEALGKKADEVIIATDYDREGENIGVEAIEIIKKVNPNVKIRRAIFSAITKEEIQNAFSNLKEVDYNLADSAQARREIDLLWGAALTRFLSTATGYLGKSFLSAGRVQTPTLALVVEKELERMKFRPEKYYEVKAELENGIIANYGKVKDKSEVEKLKSLKGPAKVTNVKEKKKKTNPPTPFNTTEFLREAANLGFTAANAMRIAETLYMNGFISYPRTDNTVYPDSLNLKQILNKLLNTKFAPLVRKILAKGKLIPTKGKKKTTDHPPIHPTEAAKNLPAREMKIYELVVRRFLATLADQSEELQTHIDFDINGYKFKANGIVIKVPGWREYYTYSKVNEVKLPKVSVGEEIPLKKILVEEKETQPPKRYGQGTIIKKMEELNLGTKATRAEILQKLVSRGYVSSGSSLIPSPIAIQLIKTLKEHVPNITSADMTAELEKEMDLIAEGKKTKDEVVNESIGVLERLIKEIEKHREEIGAGLRESKHADLGPCPKCGKGVMRIIRSKKTGKRFVACSNYPECKNTWPLPQKGKITILNETCKCGTKKIMVEFGRRRMIICPNPDCK